MLEITTTDPVYTPATFFFFFPPATTEDKTARRRRPGDKGTLGCPVRALEPVAAALALSFLLDGGVDGPVLDVEPFLPIVSQPESWQG